MRITDALLGEHGVFYAMFDHVEAALREARDLAAAQERVALLVGVLATHAEVENEILLTAMERSIGPAGPVAVMRDEHQRIEDGLAGFAEATDLDDLRRRVSEVVALAREHFAKEEQVLFRIARQQLGEQNLDRLGGEWAASRGVAVE